MSTKYLSTLICFLLAISIASSQSTICAYKYRKRITFDPTKVAGAIDLTDFPALINISSDNDLRTVANSGHVESASGFDIIFTAADGVTLLTFQLEKYTATNGQYTAWVKIPILSTSINTDIYMYYGNTAIVTDQSSTAVWTNYHGVWHLENSSFADNSPSGYNLTNNGTTNQAPAFINGGRANNGTQWLEVANTFPNITSDFTMSAWFYSSNVGTAGQRVFCDDVNNSGGYALSLGDPGSGALRFFARSTSPVSLDTPNNTIVNNTWYYVSAVADVTNKIKRIFVNGVQIVSATYTGNWGTDAGNCSVAGETAAGETANRLNGRIDAAIGILTCVFVHDFLGARGLAVVMLLLAKLMVDTGRPYLEKTSWVLVIQAWAYVLVIAGMWVTSSPWRLRDLFAFMTATPERIRTGCIIRLAFGLSVALLGVLKFQ